MKVDVLGPVHVAVSGKEVAFGRAEGRDLFALLAMSREGEATQTVIDTLWPDEGERGGRRLESAIRDVNATMRHATGLAAEVRFVVKSGVRRRLSVAYFDVDWWRFEDAYRQASSAADDAARVEALRLMVGLYQGALLDGRDDLWCAAPRQAAMTQAVNAAARLAELERKTDPDRALDVLTHAVERIDRYSELLWCQLMTTQGELGRLPAVRRSFDQLTERLAEIDAKPSAQARQIFQRFLN
ncbi:AfsR/SARP family transcriptional regulator [Herbidospora cretacea]|uniref:AfsR/SARP family transcriptional regulator n=1 Tax=Herbidospora cretacea TaxID=28444 RepID=UPI001471494A|nr:BTAD domain-containing putative transcriptional regulator [Herbidospora cretacea]